MTHAPSISQTAPVLEFEVREATAVAHAAVPTLGFAIAITGSAGTPIRSIVLETQIQIAARRRGYADAEQQRLLDLFGGPERWATTLRTLPWLRATQVVPGFTGETVAELHVPCTYDFEVTAARYLQALDDGEVPLEFLFSGTAFYSAVDGRLQTTRIGWDRDADFGMPVRVWRETMERYFPGTTWLRLGRETFDRLQAYRARHALPSWELTLDSVLEAAERRDGR